MMGEKENVYVFIYDSDIVISVIAGGILFV